MKIVVLGGTGLIGSRLVITLAEEGHAVIAASPKSGVNTLTAEGLTAAVEGAEVVVDVTNSPSLDDDAVAAFFEASASNIAKAEVGAGVRHHVALSIVGVDRLSEGGYFRGKIAQEKIIEGFPVPFTIVRATQFFEFIGGIAQRATSRDIVHLPPVLFQPMAADEVVGFLARTAVGPPVNGVIEIAGPRPHRLDQLVREYLGARGDLRRVIADPKAPYSGARLGERTLLPDGNATLGLIAFEDWLEVSSVTP